MCMARKQTRFFWFSRFVLFRVEINFNCFAIETWKYCFAPPKFFLTAIKIWSRFGSVAVFRILFIRMKWQKNTLQIFQEIYITCRASRFLWTVFCPRDVQICATSFSLVSVTIKLINLCSHEFNKSAFVAGFYAACPATWLCCSVIVVSWRIISPFVTLNFNIIK